MSLGKLSVEVAATRDVQLRSYIFILIDFLASGPRNISFLFKTCKASDTTTPARRLIDFQEPLREKHRASVDASTNEDCLQLRDRVYTQNAGSLL